jgi:hypothetical protein
VCLPAKIADLTCRQAIDDGEQPSPASHRTECSLPILGTQVHRDGSSSLPNGQVRLGVASFRLRATAAVHATASAPPFDDGAAQDALECERPELVVKLSAAPLRLFAFGRHLPSMPQGRCPDGSPLTRRVKALDLSAGSKPLRKPPSHSRASFLRAEPG